MRRIAVSRLQLSNGEILKNQIIEWDDNNVPKFYPITEELAFTEWKDCTHKLDSL